MEQNKIILYQDDNEITRVAVRFADEELMLDSTSKDFLLVREEGSRQVKRNVAHYNLDMILAVI